jgi:hypothetical protein
MPQQNPNGPSGGERLLTTLLACCWGFSSAYILFHSLLVTHDARPCFAALVPLVVVWATLERKRWGRLALLGLSAVALGLFIASIGFIAAIGTSWEPTQRTLMNYARIALRLYADDPSTALTMLLLAATTGLWLRRPVIIAEFERGKRATLAAAQRAIAMALVSCWGIILVFPPLTPLNRNTQGTRIAHSSGSAKASHDRSKSAQSRKASKRANRSAAPASNL